MKKIKFEISIIKLSIEMYWKIMLEYLYEKLRVFLIQSKILKYSIN